MPTRSPLLALFLAALAGCSGGDSPASDAPPSPTPTTYAGQLLGGLERTAIEKTRSDMNAVRTSIVAYSTGAGELPVAADFAALTSLLVPSYMRVVPGHDAWGSAFVFSGTTAGWTLIAPGADGASGTADDIVLTDGGFTQLPAGYKPAF